jgi:hypothetical protein
VEEELRCATALLRQRREREYGQIQEREREEEEEVEILLLLPLLYFACYKLLSYYHPSLRLVEDPDKGGF